jgi:polysaccharide pyruvyl transferase CsaB
MMEKKPIKNVLICGNYGIGNLGDEAILDGLIRLVSSTWPAAKITVMSSIPAATKKAHKVNAVSLFPSGIRSVFKFWFSLNSVKTMSALRKSDLVLLGGGGLFNDEKWQAIFVWFIQFCWFWAYRKRLVCVAQSVGPLRKWWSRNLVRLVFNYSKLITVRDNSSAKLLQGLSIKDVHVLADPAFAIGYESPLSRNKQNQVVISIRPWQSHNSLALYKEMAQFIDNVFEKKNLRSIFLPFQTEIENDQKCFDKISELLVNKEALEYVQPDDYTHALEIISRSKAVVGMRLHSIIFATLTATPFLALSYSNKVTAYADMIDMGEFVLTSKSFKHSEAVKILNKCLGHCDDISKRLEKEKLKKTYAFFEHEKLLKSIVSP